MATLAGLQPLVRDRAAQALARMQLLTGGRQLKGKVSGGTVPTITSGFRTGEKQRQLYAARAANPYPVNRPGDSAHEYGLAFDSWVPANQMALWVAVRESLGFRVPPHDVVHAEVPEWRSYVDR